jgi:hypothetical protein
MPQLDKFTFAPQVFWLILGFFGIYFMLLSTGLPRIYKILFFRKKKLELLFSEYKTLDQELYFSEKYLNVFLLNSINTIKLVEDVSPKVLDTGLNTFLLNNTVGLSNINILKSLDTRYLLSDMSLQRMLKNQTYYQNVGRLRSKLK